MAELPSSWGLTTKTNDKGKLEVHGKDDLGQSYRVRTCDNGELSERDVSELAAADRERYSSREAGARAFVDGMVQAGHAKRDARERLFEDDLIEAAGPVVRAGMGREGSTVGYSRAYAKNFENAFSK